MYIKYYNDHKECLAEANRILAALNEGERVVVSKPSVETNGRWKLEFFKDVV